MSDKTKYAYLAGIIDGEGCLSIGAGRRQKWGVVNYNSIMSVANTDIRLIKWLHSNFGGNFFNGKQQRPTIKKHYIWRVLRHKDIELLLLAILPYLIIKREQAIILLELVRMSRDENPAKRKELWEKMAVLNKRGIGVTTNTSSSYDKPEVFTKQNCFNEQDDFSENFDWAALQRLRKMKIESGLMGDHESDPAVTQEPQVKA
jgi:hypothetical protein